MTSEKIPNVRSEEPGHNKNLLDPVTTSIGTSILLFVLAESAKAIVGFLTLQWFARLWKRWTQSDPIVVNKGVPEEEPKRNSPVGCPCGRCHGG